MKNQKLEWKLVPHSHQIADTGDYDGCYEITNGKISLFTQDDDDEALESVIKVLNESGCKFYLDDNIEFENHLLSEENNKLHYMIENKLGYEDMQTLQLKGKLSSNFYNKVYPQGIIKINPDIKLSEEDKQKFIEAFNKQSSIVPLPKGATFELNYDYLKDNQGSEILNDIKEGDIEFSFKNNQELPNLDSECTDELYKRTYNPNDKNLDDKGTV